MTDSILNWMDIARKASDKRKAEGLTIEALAAMSGVSRPTVIALEKGSTKISLNKALSILSALGLAVSSAKADRLEDFYRLADRRERALNAELKSPLGDYLQHGNVDYVCVLVPTDPSSFRPVKWQEGLDILSKAQLNLTGLPPFAVDSNAADKPTRNAAKIIEAWSFSSQREASRRQRRNHYWMASGEGQFFLRSQLDEDSSEILAPRTVFDIAIPIWRLGELLLTMRSIANVWPSQPFSHVEVRLHYVGLSGRILKPWSSPLEIADFPLPMRSNSHRRFVTRKVLLSDIDVRLDEVVYDILAPFYSAFDFAQIPIETVSLQLNRLRNAAKARRITPSPLPCSGV